MRTQALREAQARYYQRNKESFARRQAARSTESLLWSSAKARAKKKGLEFTITVEDIILPPHCPILGMEMSRGTLTKRASSPSLDRIDNSKGYVQGNVQVISLRANRMKNDSTIQELKALITHLESL